MDDMHFYASCKTDSRRNKVVWKQVKEWVRIRIAVFKDLRCIKK